MKIKSAEFVISAPSLQACPVSPLAEFAFIGRSNVGKSSLINLLVQRNDLAMVSATPGKTKLINFFKINNAWSLVDLPGYGFAKVAQHARADFNEAVADFLEHRENLVCTFALIDSKLPAQEIDIQFLRWLSGTGRPFALVFTKTDQQPSQVAKNIAAFKTELTAAGVPIPENIFQCSAASRKGRGEILHFIDEEIRQVARGGKAKSADTGTAAAAQPAPKTDDYVDSNDWDKFT